MFPVLDITLTLTRSALSTQQLILQKFPFQGQKGKGICMCGGGLRKPVVALLLSYTETNLNEAKCIIQHNMQLTSTGLHRAVAIMFVDLHVQVAGTTFQGEAVSVPAYLEHSQCSTSCSNSEFFLSCVAASSSLESLTSFKKWSGR